MRVLAFLFALLSACTAPSCVGRVPVPKAPVSAQIAATLPVSTLAGGGGTAWLVGRDAASDYWVTAGHVCEGQPLLLLDGEDLALPLAIDREVDLCVMTASVGKRTPLKLAAGPPELGEHLWYVGNPLGAMSGGIVPMFQGFASGNDGPDLIVSIPGFPGASGSAVTNHKGEVVGLLYAVTIRFPEIAICTGVLAIHKFLEAHGVPHSRSVG